MMRSQIKTLAAAAAVAAAGLGAAAAIAACGTSGHPASTASSASTRADSQATAQYSYAYYRSMMGGYFSGGSMMGGKSYGWMMGPAGYRWMTGLSGVPGWMRGGHVPAVMMGTGADMGKFMGRLWADAPGPRVSTAEAARLGGEVPAGTHVNRAARTITFTTSSVHLVALASPAGGADERFRIAGLANPKVTVPAGARVSIQVVNADPDTAHGLVITSDRGSSSWMPMLTSRPAFPGSALWFLGNPTTTGMHTGTLTFTATTAGTYHYLCPVPGHAQKGMTGTFIVTSAR